MSDNENIKEETPRIQRRTWAGLILLAILLGTVLHGCATRHFYADAAAEASSTPASFARSWAGAQQSSVTADLLLRRLGLQADSLESNVYAALKDAYDSPQSPALEVVARVLRPGRSTDCDDDIVQKVREALARQLLGWPGDTSKDLSRLREYREAAVPGSAATEGDVTNIASRVDEACDKWREYRPSRSLFGTLFNRSEPQPAGEVAEQILGPDACLPGGSGASASKAHAECRLIQTLLQATADADEVRDSRVWINFFWGWERAAVVTLALILWFAMWILREQRKPLEHQAIGLNKLLRDADSFLTPFQGPMPPRDSAPEKAREIQEAFYKQYGGSNPSGKASAASGGAQPLQWNGGLPVLKNLMDATCESIHATDRTHLEKFVELHTQALIRQRAFLNAVITAFPAIGLIATLRGLIDALSRASGIVAGTESERFANTEIVTSILSSSFATTLLALSFMALFMLINIRAEHREVDLLENAHRQLLSVFWPGRTGSAEAAATPAPKSDARR